MISHLNQRLFATILFWILLELTLVILCFYYSLLPISVVASLHHSCSLAVDLRHPSKCHLSKYKFMKMAVKHALRLHCILFCNAAISCLMNPFQSWLLVTLAFIVYSCCMILPSTHLYRNYFPKGRKTGWWDTNLKWSINQNLRVYMFILKHIRWLKKVKKCTFNL